MKENNINNVDLAEIEGTRENFERKISSYEGDLRLMEPISLGKLDASVQKNWEIKHRSIYWKGEEDGFIELKEPCVDLKLLGLYFGGNEIEKFKSGNFEVFTPKFGNVNSEIIANEIKEHEEKVNQFESLVNREVQERMIFFLKKTYDYVIKQKNDLEEIKNNPESINKFFEGATKENPLVFEFNSENNEKLNKFFIGKMVSRVDENMVGKFLDFPKDPCLGFLRIETNLNYTVKINPSISDEVKKAGFKIKEIPYSSYIVDLPKKEIKAHILSLQKDDKGKGKIIYSGEDTVLINDQKSKSELEEVYLKIMEEINKRHEIEFMEEFELGDKMTACFVAKYDLAIPNRFIKLVDTQKKGSPNHYYYLIDRELVKGKSSITIEIPDDLKGHAIGSHGSNIREVAKELGVYIKIK